LYFLYFFSHSICLELYQKRLFSLFYHISLPVFPPLFCFFSISFTFCPILFAWKFTRNCFFSLFYIATYVHAWNFTMVSLTLCFSFTFFPFRCLELYQKLFFLLFSYIATYVHAWNFTRSCSFSTFLFMSVAT
jgi:hypothetical protein